MRRHGFLFIALGLLVGVARAGDDAASTLIAEAIRAHGGETALAKCAAVTVKTKGIFHGCDRTPVFFFAAETTTHGADQLLAVLDGELNKQKFRVVNVLDGKRGWIKLAGETKEDTQDCTPAQLFELQECAYANWVATLLPLADKRFSLTLIAEEEKVGDRPAVGVRIASPGHRDVSLFFDKETRLLVKTETRGTAGTGVEGKVETFLRLHKAFRGVQRPTMWMVYHNGRSLISHWVLDYQVADLADARTFGRP